MGCRVGGGQSPSARDKIKAAGAATLHPQASPPPRTNQRSCEHTQGGAQRHRHLVHAARDAQPQEHHLLRQRHRGKCHVHTGATPQGLQGARSTRTGPRVRSHQGQGARSTRTGPRVRSHQGQGARSTRTGPRVRSHQGQGARSTRTGPRVHSHQGQGRAVLSASITHRQFQPREPR